MTDAPHRDNKQLNTLACARPCAAVWILMRNIATKESDRALRLSPTVSGLATATLHDPDASSHRSDQGHCATDVCPGALFQAWVLLAHTPKTGRGTGVSTEEKLDGTKKREERKKEENRKEVGVCPRKIGHHAALSAEWDLLRDVSVRQQPVWSESGTTS